MIHTDKVFVVEGRYDEIKLSGLTDALIIRTDGFSLFNDREKQRLLQRLARERGLVILTDSDSAGFLIRKRLHGSIAEEYICDVFIPDIYGKERRKKKPSCEGKLGVEGVPDAVLEEALLRAGIGEAEGSKEKKEDKRKITNGDLFEDGFSGGQNSREKRARLLERLSLPSRLSKNSLLKIINIFLSFDEYKKIAAEINEPEESA